jgi:hypothetical protein
MKRKAVFLTTIAAVAALTASSPALARDDGDDEFSPGAAGVGDPYYPSDGNGGYDAKHYTLDLAYDPDSDRISGSMTMEAIATQGLSRFNLDLSGLSVRSVMVNEHTAAWSRDGDELVITPPHGLEDGDDFTATVQYAGVPQTLSDLFGLSGFIHTDDGALVMGQPHGAATWYPVSDHPSDRASYSFHIRVPKGLTAVANGVLLGKNTSNGHTTWDWEAKEPMASYLTTATIGEFDLHSYQADGVRFWDAVDPDLYAPVAQPTTGSQFAQSQVGSYGYKRLSRVIDVPAGGGSLSFTVTRDTEQPWDFFFVEAVRPGSGDWTTLPDENAHTSRSTGWSCPWWLDIHPFLAHYQTPSANGCKPSGTSGKWWGATGRSDTAEDWTIDLSAYSGQRVRIAFSYASDEIVQRSGVYVDDIVTPGGDGTTSFEQDGDVWDGWTVPGSPKGSPTNSNDWTVGTVDDLPPSIGEKVDSSFARQPEILRYLSRKFGPYPFDAAGGIVDDVYDVQFALETQTRPNYSPVFWGDQEDSGDSVVVHENAHQWYGDSLTVRRWKQIWLNEGFATYAEWLWSAHEGSYTEQENFDSIYYGFGKRSDFWKVVIGDPGPDLLFDGAVYWRGAMTLHQLREKVGDQKFFQILRTWASRNQYGTVTTHRFQRLAERISGQSLDTLFRVWLYTPEKPQLPGYRSTSSRTSVALVSTVRKALVTAQRR